MNKKVKVCDAICGAGKTQGCIDMINKDDRNRYVFITPYLDEVERIKVACSSKHFVSPERRCDNRYSKLNDIRTLLSKGANVASTHALFSCYTDEIKKLIREQEYVLILDEVIDLFQPVKLDGGDVQFLVRNNIAKKEEDAVIWDDDEYNGILFNEIMEASKSRNLVDYDGSFYFWSLPIDVFRCFKEVYVLTYLFEYQMLRYFFDANGIEYELIGTKKIGGDYRFCRIEDMDRRLNLKGKIHIVESEDLNSIGDGMFSLSAKWYERALNEQGRPKIVELKNNIRKVFRKRNTGSTDRMWTTMNRFKGYLKGKGYSNGFITFNKRATNNFAQRHTLAYCVNVFMMPWMRNYLIKIGAKDINQDMYALSVLIQWVFRSAVRKGEEVWLYVPSKRMRTIFKRWLDNLAKGEDLRELKYVATKMSKTEKTNHAICKALRERRRAER